MSEKRADVERRRLHFDSLKEILDDAESLGAGEIRTSGNWAASKIIDHVARVIEKSVDGFPQEARAPLPLRLLGPLLKGRSLRKTLPAGLKIPRGFKVIVPDEGVTLDEAMGRLRRVVQRVEGGEQMTRRSPLFGRMSHDDWRRLHCRHAELHFSFMRPSD